MPVGRSAQALGQESGPGEAIQSLPGGEAGRVSLEALDERAIPHPAPAGSAAEPGASSPGEGSADVPRQEKPASSRGADPGDLVIGSPSWGPRVLTWETEEAGQAPETSLPMNGAPAEVAARMARVIGRLVVMDENRAVVRLHPPELGRMSIRVTTEDGGVVVEMLVERQAVKAMVEAQLDQLQTALADQGLRTAAFSVQVGGDAEHEAWSWPSSRGDRDRNSGGPEPARLEAARTGGAGTLLASQDSTIDYWV